MRNRILFGLALLGIVGGVVSAYLHSRPTHPLPPAFNPAPNPFGEGIYANGIIESDQANGANMNIYPEVAGTIVKVLATEGQKVKQGSPLFEIDDTVQRALVEQQKSQAEAARSLLDELRAQPRRETLEVAGAQVAMATAGLKSAEDQLDKQRRAVALDPRAVSKDVFDNAQNAVKVALANLEVVKRQYELTRAGAWTYDVRNQQKQADALGKAVVASTALLAKYTVRAPADGVVLTIRASVGSYLSPQGAYDTYTQGYGPAVVMGTSQVFLGVRCYIDEVLIPRLPPAAKMKAKMFIRGTNVSVPLAFVRVQPYVSPKVQLSNARAERVDLRVLPIIFRFPPPKGVDLYPGELVDVYVGEN